MPKLRTFNQFKNFKEMSNYLKKPLSFLQKKHLAKIRLGSLELRIETRRFSRPSLEIHERLCLVCHDSNLASGLNPCVESEFHFLFLCSKYTYLRDIWLSKLTKPSNFNDLDEGLKLDIVLNWAENVKFTAQYIIDAFNVRSKIVNK